MVAAEPQEKFVLTDKVVDLYLALVVKKSLFESLYSFPKGIFPPLHPVFIKFVAQNMDDSACCLKSYNIFMQLFGNWLVSVAQECKKSITEDICVKDKGG